MFENDNIICVSINPAGPTPFNALSNFRSQWESDPSYKGLQLWVEEGADVHFWDTLSNILSNVVKDLSIDHLIIKIDFANPPQDISKLLQKPFCRNLKTISIEGQLSKLGIQSLFNLLLTNKSLKLFRLAECSLQIEETLDLLHKLNTSEFMEIKHFSLVGAELNSNNAMSLIEKLSLHAVKHVDLTHNSIHRGEGNKAAIFDYLCKAINESTLDTLALSLVGDAEAEVLSESLRRITRPFQLTICVTPRLTTLGIDHFTNAVRSNPNLRVILEDELNWVKSSFQSLALEKASQKNISSLFHLAARVVSKYAAIYSENDLKQLPSDCLASLPIATRAQYKLHREIADQKKTALEREKTLDEIDEIYKDQIIAALRETKLN